MMKCGVEFNLTKVHENTLMSLMRDYHQALQTFFGDRSEQVVRILYDQERRRFEYPNGLEAGPAKVLDFVPILTRRAVEERIRRMLLQSKQVLEAPSSSPLEAFGGSPLPG